MYFKDLFREPNFGFYMISWLDLGKEYSKGTVSDSLIKKIEEILKLTPIQTKGCHTCPFCKKSTSRREAFVLSQEKVYHIPEMITHYIKEHNYRPPTEFLQAVETTPLPGTEEHQKLLLKLSPIDD